MIIIINVLSLLLAFTLDHGRLLMLNAQQEHSILVLIDRFLYIFLPKNKFPRKQVSSNFYSTFRVVSVSSNEFCQKKERKKTPPKNCFAGFIGARVIMYIDLTFGCGGAARAECVRRPEHTGQGDDVHK